MHSINRIYSRRDIICIDTILAVRKAGHLNPDRTKG